MSDFNGWLLSGNEDDDFDQQKADPTEDCDSNSSDDGSKYNDSLSRKVSKKDGSHLNQRAREILPLADFTCPSSCKFGQNCINKITFKDLARERGKIWGGMKSADRDRAARAIEIDSILRRAYDSNEKVFNFKIHSSFTGVLVQICEIAMVVILHLFKGSLVDVKNIAVSHQWRKARDNISGKAFVVKRKRSNAANKTEAAVAYLERFKETSCDSSPTANPACPKRSKDCAVQKSEKGFINNMKLITARILCWPVGLQA